MCFKFFRVGYKLNVFIEIFSIRIIILLKIYYSIYLYFYCYFFLYSCVIVKVFFVKERWRERENLVFFKRVRSVIFVIGK